MPVWQSSSSNITLYDTHVHWLPRFFCAYINFFEIIMKVILSIHLLMIVFVSHTHTRPLSSVVPLLLYHLLLLYIFVLGWNANEFFNIYRRSPAVHKTNTCVRWWSVWWRRTKSRRRRASSSSSSNNINIRHNIIIKSNGPESTR